MAAKKEAPKVAQFHMVGDKVLWKGIKLTVIVVHEDGSIEAWSPTQRVHVGSPTQLEKYSGS